MFAFAFNHWSLQAHSIHLMSE